MHVGALFLFLFFFFPCPFTGAKHPPTPSPSTPQSHIKTTRTPLSPSFPSPLPSSPWLVVRLRLRCGLRKVVDDLLHERGAKGLYTRFHARARLSVAMRQRPQTHSHRPRPPAHPNPSTDSRTPLHAHIHHTQPINRPTHTPIPTHPSITALSLSRSPRARRSIRPARRWQCGGGTRGCPTAAPDRSIDFASYEMWWVGGCAVEGAGWIPGKYRSTPHDSQQRGRTTDRQGGKKTHVEVGDAPDGRVPQVGDQRPLQRLQVFEACELLRGVGGGARLISCCWTPCSCVLNCARGRGHIASTSPVRPPSRPNAIAGLVVVAVRTEEEVAVRDEAVELLHRVALEDDADVHQHDAREEEVLQRREVLLLCWIGGRGPGLDPIESPCHIHKSGVSNAPPRDPDRRSSSSLPVCPVCAGGG